MNNLKPAITTYTTHRNGDVAFRGHQNLNLIKDENKPGEHGNRPYDKTEDTQRL